MKKRMIPLIALLTVLPLATPSFAGVDKPASGSVATPTPPKAAKVRHLSGEVVSVDQQSNTLTVKTAGKKPKEFIFGVEGKASAALGDLKAGDWLKVTYRRENGKLMADSLVKSQHVTRK